MSGGKHRPSMRTVLLIVGIMVTTASIGTGFYLTHKSQQPVSSSSWSSIKSMNITGNLLTETIPISGYTVLDVRCNSCILTLQLSASDIRADVNLLGSNTTLTVNGGKSDIAVSGNNNFVDLRHCVVLSIINVGKGNTITQ